MHAQKKESGSDEEEEAKRPGAWSPGVTRRRRPSARALGTDCGRGGGGGGKKAAKEDESSDDDSSSEDEEPPKKAAPAKKAGQLLS
jgi:hypothetical protein